MGNQKKSATGDIEKTLQEIGDKIEELVRKGAEAGLGAKEDIEAKIKELKENKTTLEAELKKGKELLDREFKERTDGFRPKLEESKGFLKEGFRLIGLAIKTLIRKR